MKFAGLSDDLEVLMGQYEKLVPNGATRQQSAEKWPKPGKTLTCKDPSKPIPVKLCGDQLKSAIFQDEKKAWWVVDKREDIHGDLCVYFPKGETSNFGRTAIEMLTSLDCMRAKLCGEVNIRRKDKIRAKKGT